MDRDTRWRALALDASWDALLHQDRTHLHPPEVAPEDTALIAHVQSLGPAKPLFPDPQRAWHELLARPDIPTMEPRFTGQAGHAARQHIALPAAKRRVSSDHGLRTASSVPGPHRTPWPRQCLPYLATIFLVLVVVAIGSITLRPRSVPDSPAMLPAMIASPEPTVTIPTQVTPLLDVALPRQAMPGERVVESALAHQTILPGTNSTWDEPVLRVEYVIEGTYRVQSNGPTQVIRADAHGIPKAVAEGSEIVMAPGDAMVAWGETTSDYANPGSAPVELLSWILTPGSDSGDPTPQGWVANDVAFAPRLAGGMGSARVRLAQVALPPDGQLPPPPNTLQMSVTLPATMQGTSVAPAVATQRDGTVRNLGTEPALVYVLDLEMSAPWNAPAALGSAAPPG